VIISLNWLKEFVDIDLSTDKLVELIGSRLVEVEKTVDLGKKYRGIKIVEVKSVEKIEGSDHLTKCVINTGVIANREERSGKQSSKPQLDRHGYKSPRDDRLVQLVCGAPNVKVGMLAVWLPPKTVLPATYDSEPLVLDKRKIMGVESAGMLAAMDELDLGSDHAGIIEVSPEDAKPGDDFAEIFGLNDTLFDIEPKSLTHRPDCFGVIGFAREIAGMLGQKFEDPDWLRVIASNAKQSSKLVPVASSSSSTSQKSHLDRHGDKSPRDDVAIKVTIDDAKLCPRYQAVVLDGFDEKPAKYLTKMSVLLAKSGMRSISPIVDVTNYLMLLSGQPLHAFDYDKLTAVGCHPELVSGSRKKNSHMDSGSESGMTPHIIVRAAKDKEKLVLLDGKKIELSDKDILITSNNIPVALAGAMGGANTEIDKNTKRIVVESATFSLYNLRGTQFRHGIFSEAITRFTKGQPPALTDPVLREATRMLTDNHGMKAVSKIVDAYPREIKNKPIKLDVVQVNNLLGSDFTFDEIITTLENVGFKVTLESGVIARTKSEAIQTGSPRFARDDSAGYLQVTAPWWRTDINIAEDIIEEVGRLNGFNNIPAILPQRSFISPDPDKPGSIKSKIRQILSNNNANEILTYTFISERLLSNVGQNPKNSYKIINSISPALQYVRQSLTPSLLEKTYLNIKVPFNNFALFEINQTYQQSLGLTDEGVPVLRNNVALVIADRKKTGVAYYDAKYFVERLFSSLNIDVCFMPLAGDDASFKPFEPKRSALVKTLDQKVCYGVIGEFRQSVRKSMKLPEYVAGFELDIDMIMKTVGMLEIVSSVENTTEQDITFKVNYNLEYARLENIIKNIFIERNLWHEVTPVSIWQGKDKKTKNISFKLTFASFEKTLTGDEISGIIDDIAGAAKKELGGEVV